MNVFAQSTGGTDPLPLLSYGVLGMVVLALLTGLLWAKPAVQRLLDTIDQVTKQRDSLIEVITNQVMPALSESTQANQTLKPILEDIANVLEQVHRDMNEPRPPTPRRRPSAS